MTFKLVPQKKKRRIFLENTIRITEEHRKCYLSKKIILYANIVKIIRNSIPMEQGIFLGIAWEERQGKLALVYPVTNDEYNLKVQARGNYMYLLSYSLMNLGIPNGNYKLEEPYPKIIKNTTLFIFKPI